MKKLLFIFGFGVYFGFTTNFVNAGSLEPAENLQEVGKIALERKMPVVLFFNSQACEATSCGKLKERALGAILYFDHFPEGTQFVEIYIDSKDEIIDFYGEKSSAEELALFYNVTEMPNMVLVDGEGNQAADPIINNGAYEFFAHLLNTRIKAAMRNIRGE